MRLIKNLAVTAAGAGNTDVPRLGECSQCRLRREQCEAREFPSIPTPLFKCLRTFDEKGILASILTWQ